MELALDMGSDSQELRTPISASSIAETTTSTAATTFSTPLGGAISPTPWRRTDLPAAWDFLRQGHSPTSSFHAGVPPLFESSFTRHSSLGGPSPFDAGSPQARYGAPFSASFLPFNPPSYPPFGASHNIRSPLFHAGPSPNIGAYDEGASRRDSVVTPTTSDLSRSALGHLLSKQGPLESAQKETTAEYSQKELGEFLTKHDSELEVTRISLGWVNTCLRPFQTTSISRQGETMQVLMLNK